MAPISQREARRLQKRVADLAHKIRVQRQQGNAAYVDGAEIYRFTLNASSHAPTAIRTARKLDHAVVVLCDDDNTIRFIALPHPSESA